MINEALDRMNKILEEKQQQKENVAAALSRVKQKKAELSKQDPSSPEKNNQSQNEGSHEPSERNNNAGSGEDVDN